MLTGLQSQGIWSIIEVTCTRDVTGHAVHKEAWGGDGSQCFLRPFNSLIHFLAAPRTNPRVIYMIPVKTENAEQALKN